MQNTDKKRNNHKQEEQLTQEQRTHRRLTRTYASQPFHERNYYLHLIAYVLGWGANAISGITEASRIFAFFMGIMGSVLYGNAFSWVFTVLLIIVLEVAHRLLAQGYFREYVQNEGHDKSMNRNLATMLVLGAFLTFLSFTGGFDLIRLTSEKPQQVAAKQYDIGDYETALNPLVNQAQQDAEKYRKSKLWKGRLSDKNTKRYNELLDAAKEQETTLAQSIATLPQQNLELQAQADSINVNRERHYEQAIQDRGYGLGGVTVLAILIMYVCVYFSELYRLRHKDYLDRKYGELDPETLRSPKSTAPVAEREHTPDSTDAIVQAVLQRIGTEVTTVNTNGQRVHEVHKPHLNGTEVQNKARNPIGFHRHTVQREHSTDDVYTIAHQYRKGGKTVTTRYNLATVRGRVAQYQRKLAELGEGADGYTNANQRHKYWQQKEEKLTAKLRQNGLLDEVLQTLE